MSVNLTSYYFSMKALDASLSSGLLNHRFGVRTCASRLKFEDSDHVGWYVFLPKDAEWRTLHKYLKMLCVMHGASLHKATFAPHLRGWHLVMNEDVRDA